MAIKHICDICGADASDEKIIVPYNDKITVKGKGGHPLVMFPDFRLKEINLCKEHQIIIANFITALQEGSIIMKDEEML